MFWDEQNASVESENFENAGFVPKATTGIGQLVTQPGVSLSEVIDHEYVLTALRYETDENLINYFSNPEIVIELLHMMLDPSTDNDDKITDFGRASMCCSIISLKTTPIIEAVVNSSEAMKYLKGYLCDHHGEHNALQMQYYKDVMIALLDVFPEKVIPMLEYHSDFDYINTAFDEIYYSSIAEFLISFPKMVTKGNLMIFSKSTRCDQDRTVKWLQSLDFPRRLVDLLASDLPCLSYANIAYVYTDVLRTVRGMAGRKDIPDGSDEYFHSFYSPKILEKIFAAMQSADVTGTGPRGRSVLACGAKIFNVLAEERCSKESPAALITELGVCATLPGMIAPLRPDIPADEQFQSAFDEFLRVSVKPVYFWLTRALSIIELTSNSHSSADSSWFDLVKIVVNMANSNNEIAFRCLARDLVEPSFQSEHAGPVGRPLLQRLFHTVEKYPNFACLHDFLARFATYLFFSKPEVCSLLIPVFKEFDVVRVAMTGIMNIASTNIRANPVQKAFWHRILLALHAATMYSPSRDIIVEHVLKSESLPGTWDDFVRNHLLKHLATNQKHTALNRPSTSQKYFEDDEMDSFGDPNQTFGLNIESWTLESSETPNPFEQSANPFLGSDNDLDPFGMNKTDAGSDDWAKF